MKYLKIYTDFLRDMEELTDAEKGRLFVMMLDYAGNGNIPSPQGAERYLFGTARKMIDAQKESYSKIVQRNKDNGIKHVSNKKPNDPSWFKWVEEQEQEQKQEQEEEHKNKRFVKPTLQEVEEYCRERNNQVNASEFVDFYTSKGWKVGNTPMKDWKACVRTWEKYASRKKKNRVVTGYSQHKDIGDITHLYADI